MFCASANLLCIELYYTTALRRVSPPYVCCLASWWTVAREVFVFSFRCCCANSSPTTRRYLNPPAFDRLLCREVRRLPDGFQMHAFVTLRSLPCLFAQETSFVKTANTGLDRTSCTRPIGQSACSRLLEGFVCRHSSLYPTYPAFRAVCVQLRSTFAWRHW